MTSFSRFAGRFEARAAPASAWRRAGRAVTAALLLLFAAAAAPDGARAIEFSAPPGMNVPRQENLLRERVKKLAQELVGDKLVNVSVSVGYARTETKRPKPDPSKIKLPGFNRFITPAGTEGAVEISAEFVRLRQIFVFISDELKADATTIQKEIENLGDFNRKKGDWVQVIPVVKPEKSEEEAGEKDGAKKKPGENGAPEGDKFKKRRPSGPFSEPKSTAHLLRARSAYFKGDYNRALDYILRAIAIEPENSQAYAMLGSLYYTINWKNLALKYWERSLEIDPVNREVENLVAELRNTQ